MEPQFFTKDGRQIEFRFFEKDPDDKRKDRGTFHYPWISHLVKAYLDGKPVGYLKIAYIPLSIWRKYFDKNPWAFLKYKNWKIGDTRDPVKLWETLLRQSYFWPQDMWEHIPYLGENPSPEEAKANVEAFEKAYLNGPEMRGYRRFHVDKPDIDYIRVDTKHQRLGIGKALYQYGAMKMAERGLALHASSIQSPEAKATWKSLEERGKPVIRSKGRKKLDYRKMVKRIVARVTHTRYVDG